MTALYKKRQCAHVQIITGGEKVSLNKSFEFVGHLYRSRL